MIKILSIVVLISASLFAQSFDVFLDNALKQSPYLRSSNLEVSQAKEQGNIALRYENPSLDLIYSKFKPQKSKDDNGYSITFTQPIRLWGVGSDIDALSDATIHRATSKHSSLRAQFVRDLSLVFTKYAHKKEMLKLVKQELEIAIQIYDISLQRSIAGTISKGELLESQVDLELLEIKKHEQDLDMQESYFTLLELAGSLQEVELDSSYEFELVTQMTNYSNPEINLLSSYKDEANALFKVNTNKIKWIDISAEYESEPDQDIFRVGTSIPLAIFNNSKEERQIAKLEVHKNKLLLEQKNTELSMQLSRLKKQRESLLLLKSKNKETLKTQIKLLNMFEDGYKIAKSNLLELQNIKNKTIKTKESIIEIETQLKQNIITQNYLKGAYNE